MEAFLIDKIEEIAFERVGVDDSLWQAGVLDSITIIELASEIETEYSIEIPFDEIVETNFETVRKIIAYIEGKQ